MRKKILALFMAFTICMAFGPYEIFALTGTETDPSANVEETVLVEEPQAGQAEDVNDAEETPAETPVTEPVAGEVVVEDENVEASERAEAQAKTITVNADETTTNSIKLSWTFEEGYVPAEDEKVSVWKDGVKIADEVSESSYTATDLTQNTSYTFAVKSMVGEEVKAEGSVTAKTQILVGTVDGFRALSSYASVKLAWNPVAGAVRYNVTNAETGAVLLDGNALECWQYGFPAYDVTNTAGGPVYPADYNYKITAYDSEGNVIAESTTTGYPVRTMYYQLTFKKGVTLTSHSGGKYKTKFWKGQVVYARGFDGGRFIFDYLCADGTVRTYYALKIRAKASIWSAHINPNKEYTAEEATMYVNARGIGRKKPSNYMIWINTYTQREYVFTGTTGNWTCVQGPWLVSTGKASKPTATGSTNINRKMKSQHGVPTWNVTRYFSIHGKNKKWVLGWPRSGACVRNYNENARWIYNTCPKKTRVFVF